jgi:subtilase family serine protease
METLHLSVFKKIVRAAGRSTLFSLLALGAAVPDASALAAPQGVSQSLAGPAARIRSGVSDADMVKLGGTLHPLAQARFDSGAVEPAKHMQGMTMVFNRSAQQQADLNALNAAQENPSSKQYHKWLTPEEFAARFGMATTDLEKASSWLEHEGFTVDRIARSRDRIFFSGDAGQVNRAFSTELRYYTVKGEKHFAPSTSLSLPASLAEVVLTIGNLDDFKPHPMHRFVPTANPGFTSGTTGNHFMSPGDIATIYDINPTYQSGIDGTGQSITILGQSYVYLSDVEHFQTASGMANVKLPKLVLVPGTGPDGIATPSNEAESDLDLEWASTIAPGADVFFVYTGDGDAGGVFDSLQYAVDNRVSSIVSLSYGLCEQLIGTPANVQSIEDIAQQGVTQGQTLIASSGDDGASGCYYDTNISLADRTVLSASYPASSSFFTAVGGTQFNEGSGSYWNSTPGTDIISSALSYIPEVAWNEDFVQQGQGYLGSTGGGASILFAKPSWQTGVGGIPSDNARDVPDVSLDSAGGHDGLLFCSSDSSFWPQGQQASCNSGFRDASTGVVTEAGGTSFAAPIFAGMMALVNQKENSTGQGLINPKLYAMASDASTYASAFHDIISGDNKCDTGEATACPNGAIGYAAGVGYDQATGLGTIDLNHLAAAWGTSSLAQSTINVVPSSTTISQGASVQFAINVAGTTGGATPGGTVSILQDGNAVTPDLTLTDGAVTYTVTLTGNGTHVLVATYSGDSIYAPSEKTVTLDALTGTIVQISASSTKPLIGASDTITVAVQPTQGLNHPGGTITMSIDGTVVADTVALSNLAQASYTATFATAGAHSISVAYSGSPTFSTSTATLTINAVSPIVATTTTVKPGTATPNVGAADVFAIAVAPASGSTLPSGTVTVSVDGTASTPATVLTNGAASFSATFTTAGTHTVQVAYAGDSSFGGSSATSTVTVPREAISLSAAAVSVVSGSTASSTITASSVNGYTGTVALILSSTTPAMAHACISAPANATVTAGTPGTSTLTIATGVATCAPGSQIAQVKSSPRGMEQASVAMAGLLMLGFIKRRSRMARLLMAILAIGLAGPFLSGCGGGGTVAPSTPTPAGSYTVTITGHDIATSTITSSTTLTIVVQ